MPTDCRCAGVPHSLGIIHRHLRPSKVLLNPQADARVPLAKVTGFGLEYLVERQTWWDFMSTSPQLPYSAPELLDKLPEKHDTQCSDVYALGVVWAFTLTGTEPFAHLKPAHKYRLRALQEAVMVGRRMEPVVPNAPALLDKCRAYDPSDRPSSMQVLLALPLPVASSM